jgi:ubiquinol-cytochrome c reductase cytochrome b subunit
MTSLNDWFDSRTGYRHLMREVLLEPIPGGARWRYVWGSTLVFTFAVQVITGLFLWTAYSPSAQTAWESVYFIQDVMSYGWLVRGIHHYSAQAMVVLMALHLIQVIVDGAYRAPREINFWLGLILMQIVFGLALTGYLLPWDQKGYYATQVSTEIMGSAPVVGPLLQQLVQGGSRYGHHTLTRFFAMHAGFLPAALVLFLVLHVYMFRRHGLTVRRKDRPETTFWPDQVLRDAVACLGVLAVVILCVVFKGAELSAPADPSEPYSAARPEWYFLFLFRFLKFQSVEHYGLAFGAIYVPTAILIIFVLMPLIGRWRAGHAFNICFLFALMAGVIGLTGLAAYEDRHNADFQLAVHEADRSGERAVELARRPDMIPVAGAVTLLRDDPLSQGPKIFAANCASCHRYSGSDGTGRKVTVAAAPTPAGAPAAAPTGEIGGDTRVEAPATAADLGNFGSRDWVRAVLVDFKHQFQSLRNAADKKVGEDLLDNGEMADWSETNKAALNDPANKQSLDALVEFIASQSGRLPQSAEQKALVEPGRKIFETGALAKGKLSSACTDCHSLTPAAGGKKGGAKDSSAPILAGYASVDWLKRFVADPGRPENYGEHNHMPAFQTRLSPRESDLVVRWLAGDYYRATAANKVAE